jgi:cytochrome c
MKMKRSMIAMVAGAALLSLGLVGAASAADASALAQAKNCLACHQVGVKVVGPAYKDVAAKYKGDAGAKARLVNKVLEGGVGVWGDQIPMPPNKATVSEAEANTLVEWILSL